MNWKIRTVADVWREYVTGIAGGPAIKYLEDTHKTAWRKDRTEARFFLRRKILYDEVKRISNVNNISFDDAAIDLKKRRSDLKKGLNGLIDLIKEENKRNWFFFASIIFFVQSDVAL